MNLVLDACVMLWLVVMVLIVGLILFSSPLSPPLHHPTSAIISAIISLIQPTGSSSSPAKSGSKTTATKTKSWICAGGGGMNGHTNPLYALPYASAKSRIMIVTMSTTLMGICKEQRSVVILESVEMVKVEISWDLLIRSLRDRLGLSDGGPQGDGVCLAMYCFWSRWKDAVYIFSGAARSLSLNLQSLRVGRFSKMFLLQFGEWSIILSLEERSCFLSNKRVRGYQYPPFGLQKQYL